MADDGDTFVTIGTPFDIPEEDAPKKKALPVHEQFATDDEGRRRFHGAFTGGFSAGYFNTVGSKEGWIPSSFLSSRAKRSDSSRQKPEDFMDEEDLGEFGIAPRNVETTKLFSRERQQNEKQNEIISGDGGASLDSMVRFALEDLVVPCRISVGVKLLKKMGWKEGQGIGPRVKQQSKKKVYGCLLPLGQEEDERENEEHDIYAEGLLFAPKDTKAIKFFRKDNLHGIGYKGIDTTTQPDIPKPGYSGNLNIKGQAFGVGAFEEDDADVYSQDSVTNYDIELHDKEETQSHLHGWTGPPSHSGKGSALSNFSQASRPRLANKVFHPPSIPKGYQPFTSIKESLEEKSEKEETHKRSSNHLTSDERGRLLGEQPLPKSLKSVFDYMNQSDKDRIASANNTKVTSPPASKTITPTRPFLSQTTVVGLTGFLPFPKDPAKQARYQSFLESRKIGKEVNLPKDMCAGLTEWEREREKEEFAKSAMLFQPLKGNMAARFTRGSNTADDPDDSRCELPGGDTESVPGKAAEMIGNVTRKTFEWHPAKLLCKRFNIPEPYPSSKTVGLIQEKKEKFNLGQLFKSSADDTGQRIAECSNSSTSSPQANPPSLSAPPELAQQNTPGNQEQHTIATVVNVTTISDEQARKQKPSMDLFKAIFASSSEDESGDSQSEGEGEDIKGEEATAVSTARSTDVTVYSTQETSDGNLSRAVPSPSNVTPKECHTDMDTVGVEETGMYGPKLPPQSGKSKDVPKLEFKPRQTVPFSNRVSESDSDGGKSKTKKKYKHKHKQKGNAKESEREKTKEREKKEKRKEKRRAKEGERISKTGDHRNDEEDSQKVGKKNGKGSKPRNIPDDKEILSKLKAVQKRRMCAADFM